MNYGIVDALGLLRFVCRCVYLLLLKFKSVHTRLLEL